MPVIKAQKVPRAIESSEDIIARFCYHYQQYTFKEASNLPYKRVSQMLKVAYKEQATFLLNLTNIVSAPHTQKGSGVKKMLQYFKNIIEK